MVDVRYWRDHVLDWRNGSIVDRVICVDMDDVVVRSLLLLRMIRL